MPKTSIYLMEKEILSQKETDSLCATVARPPMGHFAMDRTTPNQQKGLSYIFKIDSIQLALVGHGFAFIFF